jgi:hypothetical protein
MGPKQKVTQLKKLIKKEINKIPVLVSLGSFGGEGGSDYSGRKELCIWFIKFFAQSKMSEKDISKRKKAYWQKVYSLAAD